MEYNLELEKIIKEIKKQKAKTILIQLPDGLKPKAAEIVNEIESKTSSRCFIWMDTNFGACDLPLGIEKLKIDLLVHFGHSKFEK